MREKVRDMEGFRRDCKGISEKAGIVPGRILKEKKRLLEEGRQNIKRQKDELENKVQEAKRITSEKYMKYHQGFLSEDEFLQWKAEREEQIKLWRRKALEFDKKLKEWERVSKEECDFLRNLMRFDGKSQLDRTFVQALIERIEVYPGNRLEISYRFPAAKFL